MAIVTFNGSPTFYVDVVNVIICIIILISIARLPFKRNYHWTFMLFASMLTVQAAIGTASAASLTVQDYSSVIRWYVIPNQFASFALAYLLLIQFAGSRIKPWQKIFLAGAFTFSAFWAISSIVDPTFFCCKGYRITPVGYGVIPGPFYDAINPLGFNYVYLIFNIPIFFQIITQYRQTKSSLVRKQLKFLALGMSFQYLAWISTVNIIVILLPGSLQFWKAVSAAILLIGLTRHGFYKVTPIQEARAMVSPPRGPLQGQSARDNLEGGRAYIGLNQKFSFRVFSDLVKSGWNGLCITVVPPNEIREKYDLKVTPVKWLAESQMKDAIHPSDLLGLSASIVDFIIRADRPAVVLDGLEYLVSVNGFKATVELVNRISRLNSQRGGIFIVSSMTEAAERLSFSQADRLELLEDLPMVHCRLKVARTVEVGETFQLEVDLFNVGKRPAFLDRVEGVLPARLKVPSGSPGYSFAGSALVLYGKRLEPLQVESLSLACQAGEPGEVTLSPKVVFRDGTETESSYQVEPTIIKVVPTQTFEFEADEAMSVFSYLVQEFIHDHMLRKQSLSESGWRSLPQISEHTRTPRSTLYGDHGRYGRPIFELVSRGLVDEKVFSEGKGRTGETTKFRISYERDPVRRYVDRGISRPN